MTVCGQKVDRAQVLFQPGFHSNTFTVQEGLYEILTVTIQMKGTDWYIPDFEVPFIIELYKVLLCVTFDSAVHSGLSKCSIQIELTFYYKIYRG